MEKNPPAAEAVQFPSAKTGWYNPSRTIFPRALHPANAEDSLTVRINPGGLAGGAMDLKQLTDEMNRFVRSKGWYGGDSRRPQTPRNLAISLVLEAAEVLEHFQWGEQASPEVKEELADTALYLLQLASILDIDLEQAVLEKLKKNQSRQWPAAPASEKDSE
jgi:NTP pyrophosphatase (non-canonical NTP hydrolase)